MHNQREVRRRHPIPVIECRQGINVADDEREYLLALFRSVIASVAWSRARRAIFYSGDFDGPEKQDMAGFVLIVRRIETRTTTLWQGVFERGQERLEVLGAINEPATGFPAPSSLDDGN
jgi:hypothetical protein